MRSFVDTVSKNGKLLINVGPRGDAQIPRAQASRLEVLGNRREGHGEANYGTRPAERAESRTRRSPDAHHRVAAQDGWLALPGGPPFEAAAVSFALRRS